MRRTRALAQWMRFDDNPQADYNFMVRLNELTTTPISHWDNGYPGFANVTAMDPDLFQCP